MINMVETDWNKALTKPSSIISIAALLLGIWVILLTIINLVEGAYSPGYKVNWLSFLGISDGDISSANDTGFSTDDAIFAVFGFLLIIAADYGMKKENSQGALPWIIGLPKSDFMNNLIRGDSINETISSWLVIIGILFYVFWSVMNNTWVDPGVYSVMISLVSFGFALHISSQAEK